MTERKSVLLGGIGPNSELSLSLAKAFVAAGYRVFAIAKDEPPAGIENLECKVFRGNLLDKSFVEGVVAELKAEGYEVDAYIHCAGALTKAGFLDSHLEVFIESLNRNFLNCLAISRSLIEEALSRRRELHIIYLGATSSLKGTTNFSAFAAAKFALRGLSQSLAREFGPQGIHICHVNIDGIIRGHRAKSFFGKAPEDCIKGEDLAALLLTLVNQPRSCWTQEIDVRPGKEKF